MPSGVVFVAILVIWAVILAPRAMRLYERSATQRTTKRFSSAMSVLGTGKTAARVAVDTARRGSRVVVDTRVPGGTPPPPGANAVGGAALARVRAAGAVRRRRRVASACAGVLMLAALGVMAGLLPLLAVPLAALPLLLFLAACVATSGQRRSSAAADRQPLAATDAGPSQVAGAVTNASPAAAAASDGAAASDAVVLPIRRARRSGLRAGTWTHARVLEADLAIAATYASAEEALGLDRYVASPSDVDGRPYLRAANE